MKKRNFGLAGSQSGQGAIEYILILFITVTIIATMLWQFSTAFRSYADSFFDGYIRCLLEVGELPGVNNASSCEAPTFDLSKGKNRGELTIGDGSGGGGGGGGAGGNSGTDGKKANGSSTSSSGSTSSSDSSSGKSSSTAPGGPAEVSGSSFGRASSSVGFFDKGKGREASTKVGNVKDSKGSGLSALDGGSFDSSSGNGKGRGKRTTINYRFYGQDDAEAREKDRPPIQQVAKNSDDGSELKPKKTVENLNRKPAAKLNDDGDGFSFGDMIRYLLIAGIIVAIVVFFGGQVLQMSKDGE